ncbi:Helicase associated domain protein [bacterium 210820-DFI.6.37]|nr:Helicase associated domain protein [bacterium 210820-DFI.6.37]
MDAGAGKEAPVAMELFEHNQSAYEAALALLSETGKAAVIHPTGTGKSFIALKFCQDHPDKTVCWLSSSEYIFKTQLENWQKAGGALPGNIRFFTYAKLMLMGKQELERVCADAVILDEFHRCGAEMWGKGVDRLLQTYPEAPLLGLSATNIRYLDNQRDMADELFDGNVASSLSLGEAIVRGILNPPKYVLSVFSYQKDLERYEKRVRDAKSKAVRAAAETYLEALRRALEKAEGLEDVFDKHMTERDGKYIVFCASVEHLHEMTALASQWFGKVDPEPHVYSVYSEDPKTSRDFAGFKADNSSHLKLLFCIDMLNEGIHVEDVSGVILLRPTVSPIIYKQQIGRALSASRKKDAVIFDIVLNIENLYSLGAVEEEMRIAMTYYRAHGMEDAIVNRTFEVIDEVRDCVELFNQLNSTLSASWELMYEAARQYYREHGDLEAPKRYLTAEGLSLGQWLNTQRRVRMGKVNGTLTDEQIKRLDSIGMRWQGLRDQRWETNYAAAKAYFQEFGNLLVNVSDKEYQGVKLGRWLAQLRSYKKSHIQSEYLTEERIAALDAIGMVWDVPDYLWEQNYHAAVRYHREHGNLEVPSYYIDEDGIRLGAWIFNMRAIRRNPSEKRGRLSREQIQKLDEIDMIWETRRNTTWNKSYEAACQYKKEHGNLDIPVAYITEDGCRLGRWIRHQRDNYKRGLSKERIAKLEAIGMVWEPEDPWDAKFRLLKRYYEEHGNINLPADYVSEGVWLARWLTEQVARMSGKPTGRNKTVKTLTSDQVKQLESLGIRKNMSRLDLVWQEQYEEAKAFFEQTGHLNLPKGYKGKSGKDLGVWLLRQRQKWKAGQLDAEKERLLSEIGMIWDVNEFKWKAAYDLAADYYREHGSLQMPVTYKTESGYGLGKWVSGQRQKKDELSQEQIERLQAIGMVWEPGTLRVRVRSRAL